MVAGEAHITALLKDAEAGDSGALDRAVAALYSDLKVRARGQMRRLANRPGMLTLQPTALVNETYLRMLKQRTQYANRDHFLAIATRVMLRVLSDYDRDRRAQKRGGGAIMLTLSGVEAGAETDVDNLAEALDKLEALDERKADVVKLRAVWGFEMAEIAETVGTSLATVERDWRFARSWLAEELAG